MAINHYVIQKPKSHLSLREIEVVSGVVGWGGVCQKQRNVCVVLLITLSNQGFSLFLKRIKAFSAFSSWQYNHSYLAYVRLRFLLNLSKFSLLICVFPSFEATEFSMNSTQSGFTVNNFSIFFKILFLLKKKLQVQKSTAKK